MDWSHSVLLLVRNVPGDTATITVKDNFINDDAGSEDGCDKIYWRVGAESDDDDGEITEGEV